MARFSDFPFEVKWSSKLEVLADELLKKWLEFSRKDADPFSKLCIVSDAATGKWLKEYYLLDKKIPQILLNADFVRLPEFINDWLEAATQKIGTGQRQASLHPYSPGVLTWRIYDILSRADPDDGLQELLVYTGEEPMRRYALSANLARLYDDYLNSRCQMLRNWEKGISWGGKGIPRWQIRLYQKLYQQEPRSYAADYEKAFAVGEETVAAAFRRAFPQYRQVEVFDIPFMPEPTLHLLEKISTAVPLTFWLFNPSSLWLGETPSKKEAIRECIRQQRKILQEDLPPEGELRQEEAAGDMSGEPEELLFGALASGARALVRNLCSDSGGRVDTFESREAIDELTELPISIFSSSSPRRELEIIKDGLLDFFRKNPDALPHDAMILCADWETYAPIMESVFSSNPASEGYIPVSVAGKNVFDTPFCRSFQELLSFRENRFEAGAVFGLLDDPAIRRKFELDDRSVDILRDMVKNANIHWGFDDDDVRRILKLEEGNGESDPYPFTWQRGLDRITAEFFSGFPEDDHAFLAVGALGDMRPCGFVEGERAEAAAHLWSFVQNLYQLRQLLMPGKEFAPEELEVILLEVISAFYDTGYEAERKGISRMRQAICRVAENMKLANISSVDTDVFLGALTEVQNGSVSGAHSPGDAVVFAPLSCPDATPRKLIWICGFNDGKFPRLSYRASYDIIGKYPTLFDVSARERDAFALLKAVLCARQQLCFSYIGKDSRTAKEIPPSVLLNDLKLFFRQKNIPYREYQMPLFAYNSSYFESGEHEVFPPSSSAVNEQVARILRQRKTAKGEIPFPLNAEGATEIDWEEFMAFFSGPNQFLFCRKGIHVPQSQYDQFSNHEPLSVKLDKKTQMDLVLTGKTEEEAAAVQVEMGKAPDPGSARKAIDELAKRFDPILAGACARFQQAERQEDTVELTLPQGKDVRIRLQYSTMELDCGQGEKMHMIYYEPYGKELTQNRILLKHVGVNAVCGNVTTVLFGPEKKVIRLKPVSVEEAKKILSGIIVLSSTPLPGEFPDYRKASPGSDELPPAWQAELSQYFLSVQEPAVRKKRGGK